MPNPVRIYVLHHPESKLAARLTNHIYDWFRLPTLEGIPVYVRSAPQPGKTCPALPARKKGDRCLEYIIPLIDAHMVRDPVWHDYLVEIKEGCDASQKEGSAEWGWRMFPVALDGTAFNLPNEVTRINFVRHGIPRSSGSADSPEKVEPAHETLEIQETLKHLTETLARDLNDRLFRTAAADRFEIFISYARADGTEVPKALRTYIQSHTQCRVFFDENDIGYGQAFADSITENAGNLARAMIVVCGDHYADRPWCRWEIGRFTRPRAVSATPVRRKAIRREIQVFQPMLVVDSLNGPRMTRVVPELAQAPSVRWAPGSERACFSVLMREVVFGLRDLMVARTMADEDLPASKAEGVVVNRLPGPVGLFQLLQAHQPHKGIAGPFTVHHPGHGLPLAELRLLERSFSNVRFQAFRDINRNLPEVMARHLEAMQKDPAYKLPLKNQVIAISTAHNAADLAVRGYLPQHQHEALIHLLRPLLRLGADLLYGGSPPKREIETHATGAASEAAERNITLTLLQMLSDEAGVVEIDERDRARRESNPLLFNLSAWPRCAKIDAKDEAAWISACRIHRVMPEHAGLPPWNGRVPEKGAALPGSFRRYQALTMSHLRKLLANGFPCPTPGAPKRHVRPAAFVFLGGATKGFTGVMPGVMQEFLHATQARVPIYLVGGLGGAAHVLARALGQAPSKALPREFTHRHYMELPGVAGEEYRNLMRELKRREVGLVHRQFDRLRSLVRSHQGRRDYKHLFSNGLDRQENQALLTTENTMEAVGLIWEGMSRVLLQRPSPLSPDLTMTSETTQITLCPPCPTRILIAFPLMCCGWN